MIRGRDFFGRPRIRFCTHVERCTVSVIRVTICVYPCSSVALLTLLRGKPTIQRKRDARDE